MDDEPEEADMDNERPFSISMRDALRAREWQPDKGPTHKRTEDERHEEARCRMGGDERLHSEV